MGKEIPLTVYSVINLYKGSPIIGSMVHLNIEVNYSLYHDENLRIFFKKNYIFKERTFDVQGL